MGRMLLTGIAGFIGSHLAETLVHEGWQVRGVDAFTDTYAPCVKRANPETSSRSPMVELVPVEGRDLLAILAEELGVEPHVAHQRTRAGDPPCTEGCADAARDLLGWAPVTDLRSGLRHQVEWHVRRRLEQAVPVPARMPSGAMPVPVGAGRGEPWTGLQ